MTTPVPEKIVSCPRCKGDSIYAAHNPYRPFCSARCKNLDFGAWASESYRVEATPSPDGIDAEDDDEAVPRH